MIVVKFKTLLCLGLPSIFRVMLYRFGVKVGVSSVKRIRAHIDSRQSFFLACRTRSVACSAPNASWLGKHCYFGWYIKDTDSIPDWHNNAFTGYQVVDRDKPWWLIPDFDPNLGDIKTVWEASRFEWVVCFAQAAANGDSSYISRLNDWLSDWITENPPYYGPNWKCGQEAAIRVLHLALAALLLEQVGSSTAVLRDLIACHLQRIEPTIGYAIGQDNNHGTSEAAALFVGGSWLSLCNDPRSQKWQALGRKWLENRANALIEDDGSFSQYSVMYHRLMLDTYSFCEVWRRSLVLPHFTNALVHKLSLATLWLQQMPGVQIGDVANLGANDGARIIPLVGTNYRDCRPSIQLASVLFKNQIAFDGQGIWNDPLQWFGLDIPTTKLQSLSSCQFDRGGYVVMRRKEVEVLIRYPRFRFRPSQADALHVDLWLNGSNILRDGGSFSYNSGSDNIKYFSGTESHNTVQFDERDQMPKLSRFLFSNWLKTDFINMLKTEEHESKFSAGYTDSFGASHRRELALSDDCLKVIDRVSGFNKKAVIRWRLQPGSWSIDGNSISDGQVRIDVTSSTAFNLRITEGFESRFYLLSVSIPVLEIETLSEGIFTTELYF